MGFDITSMKQRAKALIKAVKAFAILSGTVIVICDIILYVILSILFSRKYAVWEPFIYFFVYIILNLLVFTSLKWLCLKATREEKVTFSDIFIVLKEKQVKIIITLLVKSIFFYVGMFFFFIGMLIPFYFFRFAENVVKDDNTANPFKAFGKSMKLMKGHYIELIKLDLSFIGWWVLYVFTGGIAGVYVLPYTSMVYAEFYDYIKGQYELFDNNS